MPVTTATTTLTKSTAYYLVRYRFSVFLEMGVMKEGRRRADVLGINTKGEVVCCEVKTSIQDFRRDKKWKDYLEYCNKFYFSFPQHLYEKHKEEIRKTAKEENVGILILSQDSGYVKSVAPARRREMAQDTHRSLTIRMAWRAGDMNIRKNRRQRYYIDAPV